MDKKQKMILGGLVIAGLAYYLYQQSKKPKASTESTESTTPAPAPKSFAGNVGNREK
jgi:hypothetical protein